MKVIFFGLGSIGRRHAQIILNDFDFQLYAFRSKRGPKEPDLEIREVYTWKDVEVIKPDIAFITNPTCFHLETAIKCARLGMHLFIEKPLSHSLKGINALENICKKRKLACYVGYCLRFHPVIKKIKELIKNKRIYHAQIVCSSFLPYWRSGINHFKTYSASHKQGGGVLLDLSHELDYAQYLFGKIKIIKGICGRASQVTVDSEDFSDLLITTDKGIHVNVHLNFLSLSAERYLKIDFKDGFIMGDLKKNKIIFLYKNKKDSIKFNTGRDDYYRDQAHFFFSNLGNASRITNLRESESLLRKIVKLREKRNSR